MTDKIYISIDLMIALAVLPHMWLLDYHIESVDNTIINQKQKYLLN